MTFYYHQTEYGQVLYSSKKMKNKSSLSFAVAFFSFIWQYNNNKNIMLKCVSIVAYCLKEEIKLPSFVMIPTATMVWISLLYALGVVITYAVCILFIKNYYTVMLSTL